MRLKWDTKIPKIKMKHVIDIGSNSVRLACFADGKTLYKRLATTRLGEQLAFTGRIKAEAIERTALAVKDFVLSAEEENTQKIYIFATEAVRSAQNGADFTARVKQLCGIDLEVLSGEQEATVGLLGALGNKDGGMIDLGGASTEVTVREKGNIIYAKSLKLGAVRLYDLAGRDKRKLHKVISEKIDEYGDFRADKYDMYGVSGTATTLAALKHGLREYDPTIVHGTVLNLSEVEKYADMLLNTSLKDIEKMLTVDSRRADIIGGGSLFLAEIMKKFKIEKLTVSESDNLEGYLIYKEGKI